MNENASRRAPKAGRRISARGVREGALAFETAMLALTLALATLTIRVWAERTLSVAITTAALWIVSYVVLVCLSRDLRHGLLHLQPLAARLMNWGKSALLVIVLAFATGTSDELSRLWFAAAMVGGCLTISVAHRVLWGILNRVNGGGLVGTRVAIYGAPTDAHELAERMAAVPGTALEGVFGRLDQDGFGTCPDGTLDTLMDRCEAGEIDAVVVSLPWQHLDRLDRIVGRLEHANVDVHLLPPVELSRYGTLRCEQVGAVGLVSLFVRHDEGAAALVKAASDRVVAGLGLLFLAPLFGLVALAIRLEGSGPIFFRQMRCGLNNRGFSILKFRTMHHHLSDANADRLATRTDPRITRVGAFLRRTSIDELPQLVNVLRGDMSLVGPRPHAYGAKAAERRYEEVVDRYAARHRMLPGLTGLAQVRGFRGNTAHEQDIIRRVDSDLEYMDRWSLSLDLAILLRTIVIGLFQRNAY